MKTLAAIAKRESKAKYKQWHDRWKADSFNNASSCLDSDVAEAFYKEYWLDYASCPNGRTKVWYQYMGNFWKERPSNVIRTKLKRDFHNMLFRICTGLRKKNSKDGGRKGKR